MDTKTWYEDSYRALGLGAQRRYPNEELIRFMGRYFFGIPRAKRSDIKILEVGCGSGANLWAIAREGFDAYGIDISPEGLRLCADVLAQWGTNAKLETASMVSLPYEAATFDAIVDVYASYCLNEEEFDRFTLEVARVLKPGGRHFIFTPSKNSDAFRDPGPSRRIDGSTVDGIKRVTAPYYNNDFPFRFTTVDECAASFRKADMTIISVELTSRTYREQAEYFENVVMVAEQKPSLK